MNIEQANAIPLSDILHKLGCQPVKQKGPDIWYHSPFRDEQTASFHINISTNIWYDFGQAAGGDVVAFVCAYLQSKGNDDAVSDALRWVRNMTFIAPDMSHFAKEKAVKIAGLTIRKISDITHPVLENYLTTRGLSLAIAQRYLKEITVLNAATKKKFFALGFANEADGFELRNNAFKGCIGSKAISFVRAAHSPAHDIHVFEGFIDFLSAVEQQNSGGMPGDVIVLNSVGCLPQAMPYIKNYPYKSIYSWLDNDAAGAKASHILKSFVTAETTIAFRSMRKNYAPHKDVNAWHLSKLGL